MRSGATLECALAVLLVGRIGISSSDFLCSDLSAARVAKMLDPLGAETDSSPDFRMSDCRSLLAPESGFTSHTRVERSRYAESMSRGRER